MINYIYQLVAPRAFSIKYEDLDFGEKVIIKPRYMSVCHADQRYYLGQRDQQVLNRKLPMALIHECCGEIVYDPTRTYKYGEKVVVIPNVKGKSDSVIFENYAKDAKFLSSGSDGFLREYLDMPVNRVVSCGNISEKLASITEFVSVAAHSVRRFMNMAHERRDRIVVWGDGSLSFVMSNILRLEFPESELIVVGKNPRKLSYFSFVDQTLLADFIPSDFSFDHAFECCGGEGSYYAIDDIIRYINPQGMVTLMGVSENRVAVNTRDILEKGLTFVGCSRSGREDFERAVNYMQDRRCQQRLELIIYEDKKVCSVEDIHRVFQTDSCTPFKTIFEWGL